MEEAKELSCGFIAVRYIFKNHPHANVNNLLVYCTANIVYILDRVGIYACFYGFKNYPIDSAVNITEDS